MSEPFISEIRIMSFGFAPKGWAFCNGQLLPINQNQALFALLGATYGGDGRVNFALPNLQGRVPIHVGGRHTLGENGGEQAHTLSLNELPSHTHQAQASPSDANTSAPADGALAAADNLYGSASNLTPLNATTLASTGGGQPHQNMQPFLALNFCIALQGIFPSRS